MLFQKRILSIAAAMAIGVFSASAQTPANSASSAAKKATSSKTSAPKVHVAEGSVVTSSDDMLTLRSGKKDMNFKITSTTQKPASMNPGSNVKVNYHDEGTQHVASSIELAPTKPSATAAKPPASK
jgi:Cu/Ag efflux protein CusF